MDGRRARAPAVLRIPDVRVSMQWNNWWKRKDACGTVHPEPGRVAASDGSRNPWEAGTQGSDALGNLSESQQDVRIGGATAPPADCPRVPRRGETQEDLRFGQKAVGSEAGQPRIPGAADSEGWRGPWDPGSKTRTHRGICRRRNKTCGIDGDTRRHRGSRALVRNHKETCASCKKRNGAGGFTPAGRRTQRHGAGLKALRARR